LLGIGPTAGLGSAAKTVNQNRKTAEKKDMKGMKKSI
jgi:hypothetical protein